MKKKVLFIDGPLGGGGAERVLIDILRNLDYNKYEVDLALICKGGPLMNEIPSPVNVIELWKGYSISYKFAYRLSKWLRCNFIFSRKLNGKKLKKDYDLEVSFLEGMPLKLHALRKTKAKKATWVHADLNLDRYETSQFYKGEEIKAYNKMDYVISVSQFCEKAFIKRFPDCTAKKLVIYNPIDRDKINNLAREDSKLCFPKDKFIVMAIGRLTTQKNPLRFLEVAELANKESLPFHFVWVGDGPLREQIIIDIEKRNLQETVTLTGFASNPFPLMKQADVLMVTSDFEGFCLVICESMCLNVPVVSTRTAGPEEIIGMNEYGILTGVNAEELFDSLKEIYVNPSLRQRIKNKAISRPDDFSVAKTIRAFETLLN